MTKSIVRISIVLNLAILSLPFYYASAQREPIAPTVTITAFLLDNESSADRMPLPVGGFATLQRAIKYPQIAVRAGLEGRVAGKATIDSLGNATDVKLVYSYASILGDAFIEGVNGFKFKPGLQRGRPVSVEVTLVAMFSLHEEANPCAIDSSCLVELVMEHLSEYHHEADCKIVLRADGTATYDGYLSIEPIDTTSLPFTIRMPDNHFHGVVGGFNPLDFQRLCVLLNRLGDTKAVSSHRQVPSSVPYDKITLVALDGRRNILVSVGDDPAIWSIARTIENIANKIQWYQSVRESGNK